MGGGQIGRVLEEADKIWGVGDAEVTVECNPTSSGRELFADLAAAGVTRVSVGVQHVRPEGLAFLGREHTAGEGLATVEAALETFENVSADLMFGLPGQEVEDWVADLDRVAALGVSHLSCYQLTVEKNTAFWAAVQRGEWRPADADRQADFCEATNSALARHGFGHYEISNFARNSAVCRHNMHVWKYGDYVGVGAGAHGRVRMEGARWRTAVRKDPADYMKRMADFSHLSVFEPVPDEEAAQEAILMGLRVRDGIGLDGFAGTALKKWVREAGTEDELARFLAAGWMQQDESRLWCTEMGWLRLDAMLRALLPRWA